MTEPETTRDYGTRLRKSSVKTELHFGIVEGPWTRTKDGTAFTPNKCIVVSRGDRGTVAQVSGPTSSYGMRSTPFRIKGYERYQPVPQWLKKLILEAGYEGDWDD